MEQATGRNVFWGSGKWTSQANIAVPVLGTGGQWGSDHGALDTDLGAAAEPTRTGGGRYPRTPPGLAPLARGVDPAQPWSGSLKGALHPPLVSDEHLCWGWKASRPPPPCSRALGPGLGCGRGLLPLLPCLLQPRRVGISAYRWVPAGWLHPPSRRAAVQVSSAPPRP